MTPVQQTSEVPHEPPPVISGNEGIGVA